MTESLLLRLTNQLKARGVKNAKGVAIGLLKKRGQLDDKGKLTKTGEKAQERGRDGRAKDRSAKYSKGKHKPDDFKYNPKTNRTRLK